MKYTDDVDIDTVGESLISLFDQASTLLFFLTYIMGCLMHLIILNTANNINIPI